MRIQWSLPFVLVTAVACLPRTVGAQTFVSLDEFAADPLAQELFGPIDDSVVGYLGLLERFSVAGILREQFGFDVPTGFASFREFTDEARATVDGVPAPSGSTSISYRWDDSLETFHRFERPLAPMLSQNARTNGRNVLTIGFSYSRVDYRRFGDQELDQTVFSASDIDIVFDNGSAGRARDVLLSEVELDEDVFAVSAQFGIAEWIDVGVFIPVVDLRFRGVAIDRFFLENPDGSLTPADTRITDDGQCCRFFAAQGGRRYQHLGDIDRAAYADVTFPGIRHDVDRFGIGDVALRIKTYFGSVGEIDFGSLLVIPFPTGDEDDLLGVGSVRFEPRLLVSTASERIGAHANLGYHADVDEHDRDRFDYSVGTEIRIVDRVSFLLDHIGRMEVAGASKTRKLEIVPGIKLNVWHDLVIGVGAIVPLNREGLTTDVTPNVVFDGSVVF